VLPKRRQAEILLQQRYWQQHEAVCVCTGCRAMVPVGVRNGTADGLSPGLS
jgi:hypothetical protein